MEKEETRQEGTESVYQTSLISSSIKGISRSVEDGSAEVNRVRSSLAANKIK